MTGGKGRRVPTVRTDGLVWTEVKDEMVVYDEAKHHIHHLNPVATAVWRLCDGQRSVAEIAATCRIGEELVRLALVQLDEVGLLTGPLPAGIAAGKGSRRAFMKKVGIAAIPAIVSVTAPMAKAAASAHEGPCEDVFPCFNDNDCCGNQFCEPNTHQCMS